MPSILLATKFFIPPYRPNFVVRQRLLEKLDTGLRLNCKLMLISAPAGFGKTTLVVEWLQWLAISNSNADPKVSWLSLDQADNNLATFCKYLIAALQKNAPNLGKFTLQLLENNPLPPVGDLLLPLVNDLANLSEPILLVLDDYHLIQLPAIHEGLSFLLEHQPPQLHLIITTRQDPLLPLARWRARGQLMEIRLSDLRFSEKEAADFLNNTVGLNLRESDVAALEARTEGWIAGLQLAAVSLTQAGEEPNTNSISAIINAFTGNDRYVMDYLMDEVLGRQPVYVQNFLLRTSILERFNASLCNELLDIKNDLDRESISVRNFGEINSNPSSPPSSQEIIDYLDRSNLFLIHLDSKREWYRYHHLFAELLRHRLKLEVRTSEIYFYHQKAAHWFEAHKYTGEAVFHAVKAKDFDWLADILEKAAQNPSTWSRGEVNQLLHWLESLPPNIIEARPTLSAEVSRSTYITGDTQIAMMWLKKAENTVAALPDSPEKNRLLGIIATNHATFAMIREEIHEMLAWSKEAMRLLPKEDLFYQGRALYALAMGQEESGDIIQARKTYEEATELALSIGDIFRAMNVISGLSYLMIRQGLLNLAEQTCIKGIEISSQSVLGKTDLSLTPASSLVQVPLGAVYLERNDLAAAEKMILDALALAERGGIVSVISPDIWISILFWARLGMGNKSAAIETLHEFEKFLASPSISEHQKISYEAQRAQMVLYLGETEDASAWASRFERLERNEFIVENPSLVLVRIYLIENRIEETFSLLERLYQAAFKGGFVRNLIEILVLKAIALEQCNSLPEACSTILQAIELAAPEGFLFVFTIESPRLNELLFAARKISSDIRILEFIDRILLEKVKKDNIAPIPYVRPLTQPKYQELVEPLTERELEVLRLIGEGLSNAEIAQKLYVSLNTLKAHTQNIYSKLDVHSRVMVVNRGRELGLI